MSTTIKYTTDSMAELTEAQLLLVNEYKKKIYENEILKKVEVYKGGVLSSNQYYLTDQSEVNTILADDHNAHIIVSEFVNNHSIGLSLVYKNNLVVGKRIYVTSMDDNLICFADYDLSNDSQIYTKTVKTFFDEAGEGLYEFEYNDTGLCIHIHNLQEVQADIFPPDIGVDPDIEFTWSGNEYYQFAYPIIPEN